MSQDLLASNAIVGPIEPWLESVGGIERAFRAQDSGCVSYIVTAAGERLFVKSARTALARASLERAETLHRAIRHRALPPLLRTGASLEGPFHVYEAVPGEVLYDDVTMEGDAGRRHPDSAHACFRSLPVGRILDVLDTIFEVHVLLAEAGFVAVDFYDGSILYDFKEHQTWLCDLDEYRPGPFVLEETRLPGSSRFMAPEEFVRGSRIDQRANVFALGRTAAVLLGDGHVGSPAWRGSDECEAVARRATALNPEDRFHSVSAFRDAWADARREGLS